MNLEQAEKLISAARAKADAMGLPMCIAILDEHAYLVAFVRTGDTTLDSIQLAIDKGYTSALIRMDTQSLGEQCQPGGPLYGIQNNLGGKLVIFPGGITIWHGKQLFGAIGVSGGLVEEDQAVARAGAEAALQLFS